MVPFKCLGMVCYSPSIATMAESLDVTLKSRLGIVQGH